MNHKRRTPTETSTLLTEHERANALARFRNLRHRTTRIEFLPMGPLVVANDPEELERALVEVLTEFAATGEIPSS